MRVRRTPERRARLAEIQRMRPGMHVFEAMTSDDVAMESIEKHAKAAGVHFYTRLMAATVCAAEGFLVVQARQEGPLEIDFGEDGPVSDALTGRPIGTGPRISVPFHLGETQIFRFAPV